LFSLYEMRQESTGGKRHTNSLIVESLEIGRALADRGRAKFRAQGMCMSPCVQPGDTLHIKSRPIERIQVGDIAVIRKGGQLFGHRAIATGEDEIGPFIVTRPDRSDHGDDGPTHGENILGVVTRIERKGKPTITMQMPLGGRAKLRVALWEWWHRDARLRLIHGLERVQRLRFYRAISPLCLKTLHPKLRYEVRTPLKSGQSHDAYRSFPPDLFDASQPLQEGRPVTEWTLVAYLDATRVPAAWVTMIRRHEESPRGKDWHIKDAGARIRYRGTGLDHVVVGKAMDLLERSGVAMEKGN
jgi:hypothetical protein